ncbi:cytidyltransferase-like domain protein [Synechococcus sp. A15-127]|uniref:PfkB family carbohydrate kinase n=1 Tax=Synechococcus sp. A15-127 TaxID=1050624 RepID=UPI001648E75D|nr:PfkB family carbohydrate kinase [Synechococcus sp. A15-127]QNI95441.1 cytidyltransferase-like domain protein [Synechococcus sp. A15-127]
MPTQSLQLKDAATFEGCVLAYGHFNTIHPGHIRYLRHARGLGEQLVVALIGDGRNRYAFKQQERAEALSLLGIADALLLLEADELKAAIEALKPEVLVLGNEFKNNSEIQATLVQQRQQGRSVQFHAGDIHYATADLLSGSERDLRQQRRSLFQAACRRQGIERDQLLNAINSWGATRLIVLGDTIVDQYAACEAIGMSAEAPVVVVRELEHKNFIGGAAVVAAHISALGAQCDFISVVGSDSTAQLVRQELSTQGIGDGLSTDPSRPTTFKKRYVVENQKLFRVSRLEEHNLDADVEDQVIAQLQRLASKAHGIVISDFVYGVVTPRILEVVHRLADQHNLLLFGDLQCSSQVGSVTRFENFSLLCPNEREARLALQDKDSGLEQLSQRLLQITGSERLVMKLGPQGFIAYDRGKDGVISNQAFPALSVNPLDVAGAGDSLLALFATGLASGQAMMPTAALACCMAALAVETMGNTPISSTTLRSSLQEILQP